MNRRVVITGLGHISPIGNDVQTAWQNLIAGNSGIGPITRFDTSKFPIQFAGEVKGFNLSQYICDKEAKRMDTFIHYGISAGMQALKDAGIGCSEEVSTIAKCDPHRFGVIIGSGIGGLPKIEETFQSYIEKGCRRITPYFVPASIINMVAGHLSIKYHLQGPNLAIVTACTSGAHSIGEAMRMIKYGDADMMLAGGAESTVSPLGIGGFAAMRALSERNDDPTAASRPWDRDRDGFVLGEGAGVLVLEEYEHAKARNAHIYCEIIGYALNADAHHMTSPIPNGEGGRRCMELALNNARIDASEIDYLNAHGTSTQLGDTAEANAIKNTFCEHTKKLVVSSTKSMTGHLLGAAGGIEAIYSVLAIANNIAPPTINLNNPDNEFGLDLCANLARSITINTALSNSFGFGGTNASLIFKKLK